MSYPLLSVVVINWNARQYIVESLRSILNSDYTNLEVILIDNHSEDGSVELLRESLTIEELSRIKVIVNDKNYGAAYALNQGANLAKGKYISFVATDTKIEKNCFSELIKTFESDTTIGAVSCKLLMMNKTSMLDSVGEYLSQYGFLIQRHAGNEIDKGQFSHAAEIFSAKGTALSVRSDVFRQTGGFPQDYFMFLEETDLCWRIWLLGYRIVFVPNAHIYHASGVSINTSVNRNYLVKYYGAKNYITTVFKNLGTISLIKILPIHVAMWFFLGLWLIVKSRTKEGIYIFQGIFWNIANFKIILTRRRLIQKMRIVSDSSLFKKIMRRTNLSYLLDRRNMW